MRPRYENAEAAVRLEANGRRWHEDQEQLNRRAAETRRIAEEQRRRETQNQSWCTIM